MSKITDMQKITDKNIIEILYATQELRFGIKQYFHHKSIVFEAIKKHIFSAKDCVLIEREGKIACLTHSYYTAVIVESTNIDLEAETLITNLKVTYLKNEDDNDNETYDKIYAVPVPFQLLNKFSKEAFNKWIRKLRLKRDAENKQLDIKQLKQLLEKYPDVHR